MLSESKSQKVRNYLASHPKATPQEVQTALSKEGVEIGKEYVSQIKSRRKTRKTRAKKQNATSNRKASTTAPQKAAGRGTRSPRPYPAKTLEEAMVIPKAIREQNNGNPMETELVARASLQVAKSNNKFFYAAAAARDYGLTVRNARHGQDRTSAFRPANRFCGR